MGQGHRDRIEVIRPNAEVRVGIGSGQREDRLDRDEARHRSRLWLPAAREVARELDRREERAEGIRPEGDQDVGLVEPIPRDDPPAVAELLRLGERVGGDGVIDHVLRALERSEERLDQRERRRAHDGPGQEDELAAAVPRLAQGFRGAAVDLAPTGRRCRALRPVDEQRTAKAIWIVEVEDR